MHKKNTGKSIPLKSTAKVFAILFTVFSIFLQAPAVIENAGVAPPPAIKAVLVSNAGVFLTCRIIFLVLMGIFWGIFAWLSRQRVVKLPVDPFSHYLYTTDAKEVAEMEAIMSTGKSVTEAVDEMVLRHHPEARRDA